MGTLLKIKQIQIYLNLLKVGATDTIFRNMRSPT